MNNMGEDTEKRNPIINPENGFRAYLHYKLIFSGKYRVEDVSKKMGCSSSKLYKFMEYGQGFDVDDLVLYMDATGDLEFLEWLAKRYGKILSGPLPKSIKNLLNEILKIYSPDGNKE